MTNAEIEQCRQAFEHYGRQLYAWATARQGRAIKYRRLQAKLNEWERRLDEIEAEGTCATC